MGIWPFFCEATMYTGDAVGVAHWFVGLGGGELSSVGREHWWDDLSIGFPMGFLAKLQIHID